ncbi:hypothetical protein B0H19DRAFT_1276106 [Mycena capillaripes]|nr:hypothetical protein B0H19DRAFT_1276106 [Mycena capillaripes]
MSTSPPRKRPRSETLTSDSEDGLQSIGRYTSETLQAYLTSLRAVSADLETFTDPSKCTSLLFPSLLKSSIQYLDAPTGQYRFVHMGRPVFSSVSDHVERLDRKIPSPLALVGTYGCGKSHLLSVLASFLFSQGKRVVFLPECSLVADDAVFWLKLAFALPFADLPQTLQKILLFKTTHEFVEFARGCREDLYFLVDGFDQLQSHLKADISALTSSHFFIYTTYVLDTWMPTSRGASSIRIPSGMSSVELTEWVRHFESKLPRITNLNKAFLEYYCGSVPALLQRLFNYSTENFSDICLKYRMDDNLQTLSDEVVRCHAAIEQLPEAQRSQYRQLMSACLTETIPEIRAGSYTALYDPRYFYFDSEGRGHCACGIVRDFMIPLLRMEDLDLFTSDAWYSGVRSGTPSIRDSAIVQICLTRIGMGGLTQADAQNNNMRICTFRQDPNFGWMFEQAWKSPHMVSSFLCIPGPEVYMLNAVIVRINPKDKIAQLIPLQITTALTCIDLATRFFAVSWHKWECAVQEEGFKVVNTFVSIDSLTPESSDVSARADAFREKCRFVSPEYSIRQLNVGLIDPKLGRILQGDKYHSPPA